MKILVLTLSETDDRKIYIVVDKIETYFKCYGDGKGSIVRMVGGDWHNVKESPEFITKQLIDADTSSYNVYNSEEHK